MVSIYYRMYQYFYSYFSFIKCLISILSFLAFPIYLSFHISVFFSVPLLLSFSPWQFALLVSTGTAAASHAHSVCTAQGRVITSRVTVSAWPASSARFATKASSSRLSPSVSLLSPSIFLSFSPTDPYRSLEASSAWREVQEKYGHITVQVPLL